MVERVREELRPDLDRVEEERERIRAEERAELQRQYDEFERSRQAMEEERLRVREEGLALARAEFAVSVSAGVSAPESLDQVTASGSPEGVTGLWAVIRWSQPGRPARWRRGV